MCQDRQASEELTSDFEKTLLTRNPLPCFFIAEVSLFVFFSFLKIMNALIGRSEFPGAQVDY